jgi:hypothetical protein
VNNLIPKLSGLVDKLMNMGTFTERDKERIDKCTTIYDQSDMLLKLLKRKSQERFNAFIRALVDCDQEHIVWGLHAAVANGTVNMVCDNPLPPQESSTIESFVVNNVCANHDLLQETNENGITAIDSRLGSIKLRFLCSTRKSVENLRRLWETKILDDILTKSYCPMFSDKGLRALRVNFADGEFDRCLQSIGQVQLMTPEHRQALEWADINLLNVNVNKDLLKYLQLSKRMEEYILAGRTKEDQSAALFSIVSRRPDSSFELLVKALQSTGQTDVAAKLTEQV